MANMKKSKSKKSVKQRVKDAGKLGLGFGLYEYGPDFVMGLGQGLGLFEKGGKVGKSPKGCGAALKGYGKAMKKGKK